MKLLSKTEFERGLAAADLLELNQEVMIRIWCQQLGRWLRQHLAYKMLQTQDNVNKSHSN